MKSPENKKRPEKITLPALAVLSALSLGDSVDAHEVNGGLLRGSIEHYHGQDPESVIAQMRENITQAKTEQAIHLIKSENGEYIVMADSSIRGNEEASGVNLKMFFTAQDFERVAGEPPYKLQRIHTHPPVVLESVDPQQEYSQQKGPLPPSSYDVTSSVLSQAAADVDPSIPYISIISSVVDVTGVWESEANGEFGPLVEQINNAVQVLLADPSRIQGVSSQQAREIVIAAQDPRGLGPFLLTPAGAYFSAQMIQTIDAANDPRVGRAVHAIVNLSGMQLWINQSQSTEELQDKINYYVDTLRSIGVTMKYTPHETIEKNEE